MRSLLLNVNPEPEFETRLTTVISLASIYGSHVTCIQTLTPPIATIDPAPVAVPELMEQMEKTAQDFQEKIEARLKQAGIRWTWRRLYGDPATMIASHSRLADAIIMGSHEVYPTVSAVVQNARPPVVAIQDEEREFQADGPALIAWNGSPPVANAMRAAVPLLGGMKMVHILVIDDDHEEFPGPRALEYLSQHGISSEVHWRHSKGGEIANAIILFAQQSESGLIVAGGFGHNRIREILLGSVTRALLKNGPVPILLSR